MELTKISNSELLGRLAKLAHTERKITHLILCHINEVESRRLYAELGFDSMFRYLTAHLNYSEDAAYRRLSAARLLKKAPQVAEKLEAGTLTLTQLTQVQTALKQELKSGKVLDSDITAQVLEKIENKSAFETKQVLACEFNQPLQTHETVQPQRDQSVRLEITLTKVQYSDLEQAKRLLSHVLPDGNWAELIHHLAKSHIKKVLGKDKNQQPSITLASCQTSTQSFLVARKRRHIKTTTRRKLLMKARHCCEFKNKNTGQTCESTFQLQVDHRKPIALGGNDSPENLRILCRTHNLLEARKWGLQ
jgi:5-methylcytosine-specific restriction endonuclease McrA